MHVQEALLSLCSEPMAKTMKVRQLDIAHRARVTPPTVSKVLSGAPNSRISAETRRRVLKACKALNFDASSKRKQQNVIFGMFEVEYIRHFFFSGLFAAITSRLNYSSISLLPKSTNLKYQDADSNTYIMQGASPQTTAAAIIIDQLLPDEEILKLRQRDIPVILINRHIDHPDIPCILIDNEYITHELTRHLIGKGHRNIGFLYSTKSWEDQRRMLAGYASALIKSGIGFREKNVFEVGLEHLSLEKDEEDDYQKYLLELETRIVSIKNRPTAVITAQDTMAIQLMQVAQSQGLKVPEDLAVTGYDNTPMSRVCYPAMTSISIPFRELGAQAADVLKAVISNKKVEHRVVKLKPEIVFRQST